MEKRFRDYCNDPEYRDFLQQLVDNKMIENQPALGITKMVVDGRSDELSDLQWKTFFTYVAKVYHVDECTRCANDIPWCEMLEALDNGGYCNYCAHMMEKDD